MTKKDLSVIETDQSFLYYLLDSREDKILTCTNLINEINESLRWSRSEVVFFYISLIFIFLFNTLQFILIRSLVTSTSILFFSLFLLTSIILFFRKNKRISVNTTLLYKLKADNSKYKDLTTQISIDIDGLNRIWTSNQNLDIKFELRELDGIASNFVPFCINLKTKRIYFMPDGVYSFSNRKYTFTRYNQVSVITTPVIKKLTNGFPKDAKIRNKTWAHTRKDGMPDKRYSNNPPIFEVEYGKLSISLEQKQLPSLLISNPITCDAVARFINDLATLDYKKSQDIERVIESRVPFSIAPIISLEPVKDIPRKQTEDQNPVHTPNSVTVNDTSQPKVVIEEKAYQVVKVNSEKTSEPIHSKTTLEEQLSDDPDDFEFTLARKDFASLAKHFRDASAQKCEHVPFQAYWPTYVNMDTNQRRWYLYWRSKQREQIFLKTDLSYIFIYVYEIIHLIEYPNVNDAIASLKNIWLNYRKDHPKLDNYLVEWIGDLIAKHIGGKQALSWWQELLKETDFAITSLSADLLNPIIHFYVINKKEKDIPLSLWYKIAQYKPKYSTDNIKLNQDILFSLHNAITFWQQKENLTLITKFCHSSPSDYFKPCFVGIPGMPKQPFIFLGQKKYYLLDIKLAKQVELIIKLTENKNITNNKLITSELHEDVKDYILKQLNSKLVRYPERSNTGQLTQKEKIIVEDDDFFLDTSKIDLIKSQSYDLENFLAENEDKQTTPKDNTSYTSKEKNLIQQDKFKTLTPNQSDFSKTLSSSAVQPHTKDDLDTAKEEIFIQQGKFATLTPKQPDLAKPSSEKKLNELPNEQPPTNEIALDMEKISAILKQDILFNESPSKIIVNDIRDHIIANKNPQINASIQNIIQEEENLWFSFLANTISFDRKFITALSINGSIPNSKITQIAREERLMSNLAVDSLLEKIFLIFERCPIYEEDNNWILEEEYLQPLQEALKEKN